MFLNDVSRKLIYGIWGHFENQDLISSRFFVVSTVNFARKKSETNLYRRM